MSLKTRIYRTHVCLEDQQILSIMLDNCLDMCSHMTCQLNTDFNLSTYWLNNWLKQEISQVWKKKTKF